MRHELRVELPPQAAPTPAPASAPPRETPAIEGKPTATRPAECEPIITTPAPAIHPLEARTLSVRMNDAGEQKVELTVTERHGEVHVAVRAGDADLAGSLRENLGELVHKLEDAGLHAESWQPTQASASAAGSNDRHMEQEFSGGSHSGQQQSQDQGNNGERRQHDPERARWIEEIENTFTPDAERKIWLPT